MMKKLFKNVTALFFVILALSAVTNKVVAQKTDTYQLVSEKIANKDFVFVARSLTPMSGQLRMLTSPYDVKISKDSVVSYLPYFGKAQEAPSSPEDAGIMFTSQNFDYVFDAGKKKRWNVSIKFKDQKNTSQFSFIIYDDGSASLDVLSTFRDPISYRGNIKL